MTLTDSMIMQMLGEADAAERRAGEDALAIECSPQQVYDIELAARCETIRSYLYQAGILSDALSSPEGTRGDVSDVAREFIHYYRGGGGCTNCGGLPHSSSCFVLRFEQALSLPEHEDPLNWEHALMLQRTSSPSSAPAATPALRAATDGRPPIITADPLCHGVAPSRADSEQLSPRVSAAERPAQTWQPIESAPQRQKVLVSWVNALGNSRTTCAAFYPAGTLELDEAPDDMLNEDGMNADDGWFECREAGDAVDWHLNEKLTYWMPLPASPRSVVAPETKEK